VCDAYAAFAAAAGRETVAVDCFPVRGEVLTMTATGHRFAIDASASARKEEP